MLPAWRAPAQWPRPGRIRATNVSRTRRLVAGATAPATAPVPAGGTGAATSARPRAGSDGGLEFRCNVSPQPRHGDPCDADGAVVRRSCLRTRPHRVVGGCAKQEGHMPGAFRACISLGLVLLALACEDRRAPSRLQAGLSAGPVARWSGEGNADDSFGGYHRQIVGDTGVSFVPGRTGQALHFAATLHPMPQFSGPPRHGCQDHVAAPVASGRARTPSAGQPGRLDPWSPHP
jgi:hypothetical protein